MVEHVYFCSRLHFSIINKFTQHVGWIDLNFSVQEFVGLGSGIDSHIGGDSGGICVNLLAEGGTVTLDLRNILFTLRFYNGDCGTNFFCTLLLFLSFSHLNSDLSVYQRLFSFS